MTIPAVATKVYLDQGTDDPKQARAELATLVDRYNSLRTHLLSSAITQYPLTVGDGLRNVSNTSLAVKVASGGGVQAPAGGVQLDINGLTAETSIADGDFVAIYDITASAHRKMTKANFVTGLGGVSVIDRDMSENDIVNTASETTLYSYSVPANTLGTNKILRVTIRGDWLNNSGSARTLNLKVKFGSTTLFGDTTSGISINANRRAFSLEFDLAAINSTSAQLVNGLFSMGAAGAATTGIGDLGTGLSTTAGGSFQGEATEDSTGALSLTVTVTHATADASLSLRAKIRMIELLP